MKQPRIEFIGELKLLGQKVRMSLANNQTQNLFSGFMPRKKEIKNNLDSTVYSVEIYDDLQFFESFNPSKEFEKWAAIKVSDYLTIPTEMESLVIPAGKYAVFIHRGKGSEAHSVYRYIFEQWFPNSDYQLDARPHFAVMGEKYKNEDPSSVEKLWFPIKDKKPTIK